MTMWRTATLSSRPVSSRREAGIVKCSVLRRLISLVPVDFKHCASYGLVSVNFLNFDRPEQLLMTACGFPAVVKVLKLDDKVATVRKQCGGHRS